MRKRERKISGGGGKGGRWRRSKTVGERNGDGNGDREMLKMGRGNK